MKVGVLRVRVHLDPDLWQGADGLQLMAGGLSRGGGAGDLQVQGEAGE